MDESVKKVPITVARGDGIGPEIMDATLKILDAAGARLEPEFVTIGEEAFKQGIPTGITDEAWGSLHCTGILLKAPLTTPQGGGYKSVNVTLRKSFGLFANVRPTRTLTPFVPSKHENVNLVVVRENEEDLYAGVEYQHTADATQAIKVITRSGSERIIRYAFEYARTNGRKKVTALVKDNIMKISDGLFHSVFKEVANEYPDIDADNLIVDIGMARVADTPENFDVIVTLNLYGDIVSDIASQVAGSVGLAGSMNIGEKVGMFEAIHGSAPDIAGQGIANPSGLLNGAMLMLNHIGQGDVANKIENAWLAAIENGHATGDIAANIKGAKALNTQEFGQAVIDHLGEKPKKLPAAAEGSGESMDMSKVVTLADRPVPNKSLVGVDVFINWQGSDPAKLGSMLEENDAAALEFSALGARGVKIYPVETDLSATGDCWVARYYAPNGEVSNEIVRNLLANIQQAGLDWVKVENLYEFDGNRAYALMQGE